MSGINMTEGQAHVTATHAGMIQLRRLRLASDMSQAELGMRVGLCQSYIAAIEAGRAKPSLEKAAAIARLFHRTMDEVFAVIAVR